MGNGAMITDHKFRPLAGSADNSGRRSGISRGECAYLGRCKRPASEHAEHVHRERRTAERSAEQ